MRTIRVTGGYTDYVVGTLTDETGADLSTATIKVALILRGEDVPDLDDVAWLTPDTITYPTTGQAVVSLLIDDTTTPDDYWYWAVPIDTPTAVPVMAANAVVRVV